MHFRRGVGLVGEFFYWYCSSRCGTPFQVQGVYREMALRRGRDYEEGRHVALMYVKRIVIKFFLDYCINSRVCNYGKRAMIVLL